MVTTCQNYLCMHPLTEPTGDLRPVRVPRRIRIPRVGRHVHPKRVPRRDQVRVDGVLVLILPPCVPPAATAVMRVFLAVARRLGPVSPALVCLDAARDRLGGDPGANLDVRFFDAEARLDGEAARTAILCRQEPLPVGLREARDGNHAHAVLVVATVSRAEANAPASLISLVICRKPNQR